MIRQMLGVTQILATTLAITSLAVAPLVAAEQGAGEYETIDVAARGLPMRPAHTYSIVARDAASGQFGAAVQSHWFSVGARVIWAAPGVGAVATQSFTEVTYGPLGLELMRAGKTAQEALNALLSADAHTDVRQVGMVDANGNGAVHTGENAIIHNCDHVGDGYTVHANLMENATVCDAMVEAYENTEGDLAARMMAALFAAQMEGGDIRGKQSAAILVVEGDASTLPWDAAIFDLRVEDFETPVHELNRLLNVARGYRKMSEGDDHMTLGDVEAALQAYSDAEDIMPDNHEAVFWHALTLASIGRVDESLPLFATAFEAWPLWRDLIPRLPASGLLPDDPALIEAILAAE